MKHQYPPNAQAGLVIVKVDYTRVHIVHNQTELDSAVAEGKVVSVEFGKKDAILKRWQKVVKPVY